MENPTAEVHSENHAKIKGAYFPAILGLGLPSFRKSFQTKTAIPLSSRASLYLSTPEKKTFLQKQKKTKKKHDPG